MRKTLPKRAMSIGAAMSTMRRWLLLGAIARARADLVFDPSVERVIVNVGSNTQPSLSHDPQTVAIAVEPMVGCRIREQRNLHVLHAAVAANKTLAFMQWYNKFGESSSLGTATEKADYTTRYRGKRKIVKRDQSDDARREHSVDRKALVPQDGHAGLRL